MQIYLWHVYVCIVRLINTKNNLYIYLQENWFYSNKTHDVYVFLSIIYEAGRRLSSFTIMWNNLFIT